MTDEINPQTPSTPEGNPEEARTDEGTSPSPDQTPSENVETKEEGETEVDLDKVDPTKLTPAEQSRVKLFQADYSRKTQDLKLKERELDLKLKEAGQQPPKETASSMSDDELKGIFGEDNPVYKEISAARREASEAKQQIEKLKRVTDYSLSENMKTSLKAERRDVLEKYPYLKDTKEGKLILEKSSEVWKQDRLQRSLPQIIEEDYMPAITLGKNVARQNLETKRQTNVSMGGTAVPPQAVDVKNLGNLRWDSLSPAQRTALKKASSQ